MQGYLPLVERVTSGFPLSVGTSQAFETLFAPTQKPYDPERKIPEAPDLTKFQSCYINLDTMFRNLVGALDKVQYQKAGYAAFLATIEEEIDVITQLFQSSANYCVPIFYHSTYEDLRAKINSYHSDMVKLRVASTDNQRLYEDTRAKVINHLNRRSDKILKIKGALVPDRYESSIVLSHIPYDLVKYNKFNEIVLLESNTGVVKTRAEWYTKFYKHPSSTLENIPFNEKTLQIFGDRVLIAPMKISIRDTLLGVADQRKWTSLTTMEKMDLDISLSVRDPAFVAAWRIL